MQLLRSVGAILCRLDEIGKMTSAEYEKWRYYKTLGEEGFQDELDPSVSGLGLQEAQSPRSSDAQGEV